MSKDNVSNPFVANTVFPLWVTKGQPCHLHGPSRHGGTMRCVLPTMAPQHLPHGQANSWQICAGLALDFLPPLVTSPTIFYLMYLPPPSAQSLTHSPLSPAAPCLPMETSVPLMVAPCCLAAKQPREKGGSKILFIYLKFRAVLTCQVIREREEGKRLSHTKGLPLAMDF